jgi:hypothetical protein
MEPASSFPILWSGWRDRKRECVVAKAGIEPATRGFSVHCSTPELPSLLVDIFRRRVGDSEFLGGMEPETYSWRSIRVLDVVTTGLRAAETDDDFADPFHWAANLFAFLASRIRIIFCMSRMPFILARATAMACVTAQL